MKLVTTLLTLACVGAFSAMQAQDLRENEVPQTVRDAFTQEFPDTQHSEWEMEDGRYKVEFKHKDHAENEAWYDESGRRTRWERDIFANDLPVEISNKIRAEYKDYTIEDVEEIEENGEKTYKVEIENRRTDEDIDLVFDAKGNILRRH